MNSALRPSFSPPPRHHTLRPDDPSPRLPLFEPRWPSEEEVHREHRAALEATLLLPVAPVDELIFELENGRLCLRAARR